MKPTLRLLCALSLPVLATAAALLARAGWDGDFSKEQAPSHSRCAVLISNDSSERHLQNLEAAEAALRRWHFDDIAVLGKVTVPTAAEVQLALSNAKKQDRNLSLLYLTGHGSLRFSAEHPEGMPILMLKDRPLTAENLAQNLGNGPCAIYIDQCYSPAFMDELARRLRGQFLLLSDKNAEHSTACCAPFSGRFWNALTESTGEPFFKHINFVWDKTCSDGSRILLGKSLNGRLTP
ncbi:MAG: hypothetical protein AB1656_08920 [Candidatus Omnitrophota bacterium]